MIEFDDQEKVTYSEPESLDVKLSTAGKLSAPTKLRVTDYTMNDTLKLSTATSENIFELLIEVLQARVQDDFDIRLLHENEMEEILLSLYANFWNQVIVDYPFPWKEEDLKDLSPERTEAIKTGKEKLITDIDLKNIKIEEIPEEFKEPIVISDGTRKYGLRLPRIGDFILVEEELRKKYAVMDKKFSDLSYLNDQGADLKKEAGDRLVPFLKYQKERAIHFLSLKQIILLQFVKEDEEKIELKGFQEKYDAYSKMSQKLWTMFTKKMSEIKFGVDHDNVPMKNPLTGNIEKRRCLFQVLDFIPTNELSDDSGFTLQFGD